MLQGMLRSQQWPVIWAYIEAPAASSAWVPSSCPDQQAKCRGVRPQRVSPWLINLHTRDAFVILKQEEHN
jgi:hypothetical protein